MEMTEYMRLNTESITPKRQTAGAAGFDLHADTHDHGLIIPVGGREMIHTGIVAAIPDGWVGIIKPRSSLAWKYGIDVLAGVIDSDYRGEIKVILQNHGEVPFTVSTGDRIAQMVILPYLALASEVKFTKGTERGEGAFGSTGI